MTTRPCPPPPDYSGWNHYEPLAIICRLPPLPEDFTAQGLAPRVGTRLRCAYQGCDRIAGVHAMAHRCAMCQSVTYCSRDCQVDHWVRGHADLCNPVREASLGGRYARALIENCGTTLYAAMLSLVDSLASTPGPGNTPPPTNLSEAFGRYAPLWGVEVIAVLRSQYDPFEANLMGSIEGAILLPLQISNLRKEVNAQQTEGEAIADRILYHTCFAGTQCFAIKVTILPNPAILAPLNQNQQDALLREYQSDIATIEVHQEALNTRLNPTVIMARSGFRVYAKSRDSPGLIPHSVLRQILPPYAVDLLL